MSFIAMLVALLLIGASLATGLMEGEAPSKLKLMAFSYFTFFLILLFLQASDRRSAKVEGISGSSVIHSKIFSNLVVGLFSANLIVGIAVLWAFGSV